MLIGSTIAIVYIREPKADMRGATTAFIALLSTVIGALLGLLAGKSIEAKVLGQRPDDEQGKETDDLSEG